MPAIDYYFTCASPWATLGHPRLREIAARHGAEIVYRPIDLGQIFPASGGLPLPKRAPQRVAYRMMELKRWVPFLGAEGFNLEPAFFPVADGLAVRTLIAARETGAASGDALGDLVYAFMRAVWFEDRNIADADTLREICAAQGLDAGLVDRADSDEVVERLRADSEAALARGVFGAPTYALAGADDLLWGQDRLDFLDRALAKAAA